MKAGQNNSSISSLVCWSRARKEDFFCFKSSTLYESKSGNAALCVFTLNSTRQKSIKWLFCLDGVVVAVVIVLSVCVKMFFLLGNFFFSFLGDVKRFFQLTSLKMSSWGLYMIFCSFKITQKSTLNF